MNGSMRKRPLDSFLEDKAREYDEVSKLAYEDRLKYLKRLWTFEFEHRDSDPMKEFRVGLETKQDTSIQNAVSRVNFAAQSPPREHVQDLLRKAQDTTSDQFLDIVRKIDEIREAFEAVEKLVPETYEGIQSQKFLRDLAEGQYNPKIDADKIQAYYVSENETKTEVPTKTEAENKTPTETKTEVPIETKAEVAAPAAAGAPTGNETMVAAPVAAGVPVETKA